MNNAQNSLVLPPIFTVMPRPKKETHTVPFVPEAMATDVVGYTRYFIKNAPYRKTQKGRLGLRPTTLSNYRNFLLHFEAFQNEMGTDHILFSQLNKALVGHFTKWLLEVRQFSENHSGRLLGSLKTLALDAKKNEIAVHVYVQHVRGFAQQQQQRILTILTFEDLRKIEATPLTQKHLINAQRWIILGFWLGQRVSDLLVLTPSQLRDAPNGGLYVDIVQQKTDKRVTIGVIDPSALTILRHHFPYKLYPSRFNQYLKLVLKAAGLDQMVKGYKFNPQTQRKELGLFPKYSVISSHDLRRSFATNFFGKIPTPVLMEMTGHAREATFMSYIGRDPLRDAFADRFMEGVLRLQS
ncbi:MAG: tyrosine-type recombinase/integrase [Flavobacteriaceae bacterium]